MGGLSCCSGHFLSKTRFYRVTKTSLLEMTELEKVENSGTKGGGSGDQSTASVESQLTNERVARGGRGDSPQFGSRIDL